MSQSQTFSSINFRDKIRPTTAHSFEDERNKNRIIPYSGANNISKSNITTFVQPPLTTTTITTKHYPTTPEPANNPQHLQMDQLKRREEMVQQQQYQKLVEKHQRQQLELLKQREQQLQEEQQQHRLQLILEQEERRNQSRKYHEDKLQNQKEYLKQLQQSGVRLTGIYPPEYFQNESDEILPDGVDYYLPPPLEFSFSDQNAVDIVAIPPPDQYEVNTGVSLSRQDSKSPSALKTDNTNLKLFVTAATFSPTKNLVHTSKMNHKLYEDARSQQKSSGDLKTNSYEEETKLNGISTGAVDLVKTLQTFDTKKTNIKLVDQVNASEISNVNREVGMKIDHRTSNAMKIDNAAAKEPLESHQPTQQLGNLTEIEEKPNFKLPMELYSLTWGKIPASEISDSSPKETSPTEKLSTGWFQAPVSPGTSRTSGGSVPPVLIRRPVDKSGLVDGKMRMSGNTTQEEKYTGVTSVGKEETSKLTPEAVDTTILENESSSIRNKSDKGAEGTENNGVLNNENKTDALTCSLEKNNKAQQPRLSGSFSKPIEIRKEVGYSSVNRKSSIKYKLESKPPTPNKANTDKTTTSQGFRLPTPELKVQYVSRSPKSSTNQIPTLTDSPNETSASKNFFTNLTTPWNVKKSVPTAEEGKAKDDGIVKNPDVKLSNTQKFLNLLSIKSSPTLAFKFHRNKNGDKSKSETKKARKKSVDILGSNSKKVFQHHSTPPLKPRNRSDSDSEENKSPDPSFGTSTLSTPANRPSKMLEDGQSKEQKPAAELLAMETDAEGVPTKHLVITPSSKFPQSNSGSRAGSTTPKHSRQNSNASTVFSGDLTTILNKSENTHEPPPSQHFIIVAIDFGTTYSGYAFSFVRDSDSLHIMRRWEGGDPGLVNQKTMTTLLLDPEGKFHSFGFTARDSYHDLDPEEARRWLYFEKFKMTLHNNAELNKDTTIRGSNGKPYSALLVFSQALKYFKDHALQELTDQSETTIYNEDIRWVITVPAIWKAPAKQFMRHAAYQAGIASRENPTQLLIALEPEAASIYVRKLRIYQLVPESSAALSTLSTSTCSADALEGRRDPTPEPPTPDKGNVYKEKVKYKTLPSTSSAKLLMSPTSSTTTVGQEVDIDGTRYMVVDCGGGTVDITVHEMEANGGSLKELHKATGGPYGSIGIDYEFEKLLISIFGPEFIDSFKLKRPSGWIDLMTAFESRKRSAHPDKVNSLNIALPFSIIEFYKKNKGSSVDSAIKKFGNKEITWSSQGMLRLTPGMMRKLFQSTVDKIKQAIGDILNHPSTRGVKYLFLVGGFAESGILQSELRKEFSHILKIVIPQDVGTTILKGAVCFGLDPTVVSVRRCRLTYGVGVLNRFIDGVHPLSKVVVKDGVRWCMDVLDKFVIADQPVAFGDTVVRSYAPAKTGQRSCVVHIYCSETADAMFVTDPGVRRCGTLCLDTTEAQYRQQPSGAPLIKSRRAREIQTRMTFGDTEIKVSAVDVATGKCVRSTVDFLGR